ncbi:MAG: peptidoglycan-binding domain-containing protein, partial [Methylocystaceae bacterium]
YQPPSPSVSQAATAKASVPSPSLPEPSPAQNSATSTAGDTSDTSTQDLSGSDIAQVGNMLETLGYNTTAGIVPAVQKYQQDNALNATGALDIDTLQSMVNQIRINRIKQLSNTKAS